MPWWAWILALVVAVIVLQELRARFRARNPRFYFARASERGDEVLTIIDQVGAELNKENPSRAKLRVYLKKLGRLRSEQLVDVVPNPEMEIHRRRYFEFMDIHYRILDDILNNEARNAESLALLMDQFSVSVHRDFDSTYQRTRQLMDETGQPMPDLSKYNRR